MKQTPPLQALLALNPQPPRSRHRAAHLDPLHTPSLEVARPSGPKALSYV